MWLERVTRDSERYLFDRKCGYCHQTAADGVVRRVNLVAGRFGEGNPQGTPWLERGEFAHRSHRAVECEDCHTQARASTTTADVLVPGMKSCLPCHGESGTALDRCATCHLYHNRSLERAPTAPSWPGGAAMMVAYGATHPGRQRSNNEDAFFIAVPLGAAVVADGMGGHNCGEVGSAITIQTVGEYLAAPENNLTNEELAREAIRAANQKVLDAARLRTECEGMGSTVVMALWDGGESGDRQRGR